MMAEKLLIPPERNGMRRPMRLMRLATRWHRTQATRIWHHPEFKPFTDQDHDALRESLGLSQIVFDEPENDLLVLFVSEQLKT